MPILIVAIFVGWYFYRSAANIGKNGFLWVGIALATFISITIIVGLSIRYLGESLLEIEPEDSLIIGYGLGLVAGIIGLSIVNYFLNKIPD